MKQIFLSIQNRLAEIDELSYIDKDWGQLQYEQPPVQWPCALIDVANIDYTQQGNGAQTAQASITITVADTIPATSSYQSPTREDSYAIIDLLEEIQQKLQLFSNGSTFTPLMRTNLMKAAANGEYVVYQMTYKTAFTVLKRETGKQYVTVSQVVSKREPAAVIIQVETPTETPEETPEETTEPTDPQQP